MRLVWVLALSFVIAGCVGDAPSASAPMAAPSSSPPPDGDVAGSEESEAEPVLEVLSLPSSITLTQGAVVCPPQTRSHCVAPAGFPAWGMGDWIEGELSSVRMIATWTAATPATTSLRVYAGACLGVEEDYTCEEFAHIEGQSPVTIDVPRVQAEFNYYYVGISVIDATEYASASTEQAVALDGEITWYRA